MVNRCMAQRVAMPAESRVSGRSTVIGGGEQVRGEGKRRARNGWSTCASGLYKSKEL